MKRAFSISGALIRNSIPLSIKTLKKNNLKANKTENPLKYSKKGTDFLILQSNSQNHNIV